MASAPTETVVPQAQTPRTHAEQAGVDLDWLARKIEYQRFQDCVHCGLCTASCPTYLETGNENDSPRGRIYLMRAVTDGRLAMSDQVRSHIDLCLDCRACETACPSGVQYGKIVEPFKVALQKTAPPEKRSWLQDVVLRHLFPYGDRVKLALGPARWMQKLGVLSLADKAGLTRLLPTSLQRMQAMLPDDLRSATRLPDVLPPIGPRRAKVALFLGCVADAMFPETNAATARVLQQNGCEVHVPRSQVCCGAIHYHSGFEDPAMGLVRTNLQALNPDDYDAIIVNAAGCGAMLKDYGHLLHDQADAGAAQRFTDKVKDVSEFLYQLGPIPPKHPVPMTVTYHDPCHLCHGQQVRSQPRALLGLIPGLELVSLEESEICCGAAGTYNLTQPEMSERLGRRKMDQIEKTGAQMVVTGNVGCILQIARKAKERGGKVKVAHPIDLLDQAYRGA
jgi:glycolate oxidase iron-sulfur subunit